ncbi:3788_t:CDS:2, partial [Gigaspora rosea]
NQNKVKHVDYWWKPIRKWVTTIVSALDKILKISFIIDVTHYLCDLKDSVSKVLEVITSDTSPRSDYCRLPPPSPEFVQVTVVVSNERYNSFIEI